MRGEFALFRGKARAHQRRFDPPPERCQRLRGGDARPDRARPRAAEAAERFDREFEFLAADMAERVRQFLGEAVIHLADEAQGQVVVLLRRPARAGQPAGEPGKRAADILRQEYRGEEAQIRPGYSNSVRTPV